METRLALISIIVSNRKASEQINALLSEYGEYIVGRMGVPYKERQISLISVAIDAPNEKINALTGRLGMLEGVSAKTLFNKV